MSLGDTIKDFGEPPPNELLSTGNEVLHVVKIIYTNK